MDQNDLILGAAIALGIGLWALKAPLQDITEPVGRVVGSIADIAEFPGGLLQDVKSWGDDDRWFS